MTVSWRKQVLSLIFTEESAILLLPSRRELVQHADTAAHEGDVLADLHKILEVATNRPPRPFGRISDGVLYEQEIAILHLIQIHPTAARPAQPRRGYAW